MRTESSTVRRAPRVSPVRPDVLSQARLRSFGLTRADRSPTADTRPGHRVEAHGGALGTYQGTTPGGTVVVSWDPPGTRRTATLRYGGTYAFRTVPPSPFDPGIRLPSGVNVEIRHEDAHGRALVRYQGEHYAWVDVTDILPD